MALDLRTLHARRRSARPCVEALERRELLADGIPASFGATVAQPDGKVVAVGSVTVAPGEQDFAVERFNNLNDFLSFGLPTPQNTASFPGGDPTFQGGAAAIIPFQVGGHADVAQMGLILPDGKILVAGSSSTGPGTGVVAATRLNADGSLDTSFAFEGRVTVGFAPGGLDGVTVTGLAIGPDGGAVIMGYAQDASGGAVILTARLAPSGVPAGSSEVPLAPPGFADARVGTIALPANAGTPGAPPSPVSFAQPDGKIVFVGSARPVGSTSRTFVLLRLNRDGSADGTFGTGGRRAIDFSPAVDAQATSVGFQADGKLVAAGFAKASASAPGMLAVARLNPDGSPDPTFGTGGLRTFPFSDFGTPIDVRGVGGVVFLPGGKIQVNGRGLIDQVVFTASARLNADGTLDPSFGVGGLLEGPASGGGVPIAYFPVIIRNVAPAPDRGIPTVRVAAAQRVRRTPKVASIRLTFGSRIYPASAADPSKYLVTTAPAKKKAAVPIAIRAVTYDDATRRVTLLFARPARGPLRLIVLPGLVGAGGLASASPFIKVVK